MDFEKAAGSTMVLAIALAICLGAFVVLLLSLLLD
jgi:hypothetical protein